MLNLTVGAEGGPAERIVGDQRDQELGLVGRRVERGSSGEALTRAGSHGRKKYARAGASARKTAAEIEHVLPWGA